MIAILKKWNGKFEVDGEIYENLDDVIDKEDGVDFSVVLLPKEEQEDGESQQL